MVNASDGKESASAAFVVGVNDVNEPPSLLVSAMRLSESAAGGTTIGSIRPGDVDSDMEDVPVQEELFYATVGLRLEGCAHYNAHDVVKFCCTIAGFGRIILHSLKNAGRSSPSTAQRAPMNARNPVPRGADTSGSLVIDYEDIIRHELELRATEVGPDTPLYTTATLTIDIVDEPDVTIEKWGVGGEAVSPFSRDTFPTLGTGSNGKPISITISGTNFGSMHPPVRSPKPGNGASAGNGPFEVTYGVDGDGYTAKGCEQVRSSTRKTMNNKD